MTESNEAEIRVMGPHAKECQNPPGLEEARIDSTLEPPKALQLDTDFRLLDCRNVRE